MLNEYLIEMLHYDLLVLNYDNSIGVSTNLRLFKNLYISFQGYT